MNRFWGRNENNASEMRFARDDEQLLALNYENLCDGDYLTRLFLTDSSGSDKSDNLSHDSNSLTESGSGVVNSDTPEDIILFGSDLELGRTFLEKRFAGDLIATLKNQETQSGIVNKQVLVFEHMGKVMIESINLPNKHESEITVSTKTEEKQNICHFASKSLFASLNTLQKKDGILKYNTFQSLVSMIFDMFLESSNSFLNSIDQHSFSQNSIWSHSYNSSLRTIFSRGILMSLNGNSDLTLNSSVVENNLKLAMTCFYGLLIVGLNSRNPNELLLATSHLTSILLQADEWQETLISELKLLSSNSITLNTPLSQPAVKTTDRNVVPKIKHNMLHEGSKLNAVPNSIRFLTKPITINVEPGAATLFKTGPPNSISAPSESNGLQNFNKGILERQISEEVRVHDEEYHNSHNAHNSSGSLNIHTVNLIPNVPKSNKNSLLDKSNNSLDLKHKTTPVIRVKASTNIDPNEQNESLYNHKLQSFANGSKVINNITVNNVTVHYDNQPHATRIGSSENSKNDRVNTANGQRGTGKHKNDLLDHPTNTAVSPQQSQRQHNKNHSHTGNTNQSQITRPKIQRNNSHLLADQDNNSSRSTHLLLNTFSPVGVTQNANTLPIMSNNNNKNPLNHLPADKMKRDIKMLKESIQAILTIPRPMLKLLQDACVLIYESSKCNAPMLTINPNLLNNQESKVPLSISFSYVWTSGQNSYGELGLGDTNPRNRFSCIKSLDSMNIVSIGAGNEHSLFVTSDGKLLSAGYNDNGQCGVGNTQQVRHPTLIAALEGEEIAQVHVYNGCEHTLAVSKDGKLFSFGYNYRGQLGLGNTTSESTPRPVRSLLNRKIILAACSYHHSFMLCSDGTLFSCGRNDCGQLGHGDTVDKKTPQTVMNCPRGIISISCGQFHTVAATSSGIVYVCGKNDYGQLGLENVSSVKSFARLNHSAALSTTTDTDGVILVCCGYYHTLLLSHNGTVSGFGRNDYGQLGLGHSQPKVFQVTSIPSLRDKGVTMVSAGCYHSIVVTSNGMLYVFGRNNHGQLATGDLEERHTPHPVDDFIGQTILSVAAGFYHTIVLAINSSDQLNSGSTRKNSTGTLDMKSYQEKIFFDVLPFPYLVNLLTKAPSVRNLLATASGNSGNSGQFGIDYSILSSLIEKNGNSLMLQAWMKGFEDKGRHRRNLVSEMLKDCSVLTGLNWSTSNSLMSTGKHQTTILSNKKEPIIVKSDSFGGKEILEKDFKIQPSSETTAAKYLLSSPRDIRSQFTANELLNFLVSHIDSLILHPSEVSVTKSTPEQSSSVKNVDVDITSTIENSSMEEIDSSCQDLEGVNSGICALVCMIEVSRKIVDDQIGLRGGTDPSNKLGISSLHALHFLHTLIQTVPRIINNNNVLITKALEQLFEVSRRPDSISVETHDSTRNVTMFDSISFRQESEQCEEFTLFSLPHPMGSGSSNSNKVISSSTIRDISERCNLNFKYDSNANKSNVPTVANSKDTLQAHQEIVCKSLILLRQSLLYLYYSLHPPIQIQNSNPSEDDNFGIKCEEIIAEVASTLSLFQYILLPTSASRSKFFSSLTDSLIHPTSVRNHSNHKEISKSRPGTQHQQSNPNSLLSGSIKFGSFSSPLSQTSHDTQSLITPWECTVQLSERLLTLFCANFKKTSEVIQIFQQSSKDGMIIFRSLANLYSHYSKLHLQRKLQNSSNQNGNGILSAAQIDNKRLMSVLEQVVASFVKVAVPLIYAYLNDKFTNQHELPLGKISHDAQVNDRNSRGSSRGNIIGQNTQIANKSFSGMAQITHVDSFSLLIFNRTKLAMYGIETLQGLMRDAEEILDTLLSYPIHPPEDVLTQIRYGTIIPSILPSILLFGIGFTKYGCLVVEILPNLLNLVRKLQQIGKAESLNVSAAGKAIIAIQSATVSLGESKQQGIGASLSAIDTVLCAVNYPVVPTYINQSPFSNTVTLHWIQNSFTSNSSAQGHNDDQTMSSVSTHAKSSQNTVNGVDENSNRIKMDVQQNSNSSQNANTGNNQAIVAQQSLSWWHRLLKLTLNLGTSVSNCLIHAPVRELPQSFYTAGDVLPTFELNFRPTQFREITSHPVWRFLTLHDKYKEICNSNPFENVKGSKDNEKESIKITLQSNTDRSSISSRTTSLCNSARNKHILKDPVYKMLSQSSQNSVAGSIMHSIEELLLECAFHVSSAFILTFKAGLDAKISEYFLVIVRVTKHVQSRRTELMNSASFDTNKELSWSDLLTTVFNIIKIFAKVLLQSSRLLSISILPISNKKSKFAPFRRSILVIICLNRWKNLMRIQIKKAGSDAINFVFTALNNVTSGFATVDIDTISSKIHKVFKSISHSNTSLRNYSFGLKTIQSLLEETTSTSMKNEVLTSVINAIREKNEEDLEKKAVYNFGKQATIWSDCCDSDTLRGVNKVDSDILNYTMKAIVSLANSPLNQFGVHELNHISYCMKMAQLLEDRKRNSFHSFYGNYPFVPFYILKNLLILLNEKNKLSLNSSDDKGSLAPRKGINGKERSVAFRKASHSIITYIQSFCVRTFGSGNLIVESNGSIFHQVIKIHNALIQYYQQQRNESELSQDEPSLKTKNLTANENASITSNDSSANSNGPNSPATTKAGGSPGNNGAINSKKRCQDLVGKPMEFCRSVDGLVVQGEKLVNNFKSMDFSLTMWIFIAKKPGNKHGFITGKISHNDAWPLILLRSDGKIEVIFGHNNEYERMVSENVITPHNWAHIACIVEQKKIKLFINGLLDIQVNTSKSNGRAMLYSVVVGTCPSSVRTRVTYVREGFDGMLAQYRYYTRALSPIHVKVIFDNGPPENTDISERCIYRLLASLKYVVLACTNSDFMPDAMHDCAQTLFSVFITDSCRRTRFTALDILSTILLSNTTQDLSLIESSKATSSDISQLHTLRSLTDCAFLKEGANSNENLVLYFIRTIGTCWAPHLLFSAPDESEVMNGGSNKSKTKLIGGVNENFKETSGYANNIHFEEISDNYSRLGSQIKRPCIELQNSLFESFLKYFPILPASKDPWTNLLNGNTRSGKYGSIESLQPTTTGNVNEESSSCDKSDSQTDYRLEFCNNIVKFLRNLVKGSNWLHALVNVVNTILTKSKHGFEQAEDLDQVIRIDLIGIAVLLGGGSGGSFIGSTVHNFFGDSIGRILFINKTTHCVHVLCANQNDKSKKLVQVRLSDVVIPTGNSLTEDQLSIAMFGTSSQIISDAILQFMVSLSPYVSLLLSDFLSVYHPNHSFQLKTLLSCLRPVEIFLFNQFLYCLSSEKDQIVDQIGIPNVQRISSILEKAATSTLRLQSISENGSEMEAAPFPSGEDDEQLGSKSGEVSLSTLWNQSSNFVASIPNQLSVRHFMPTSEADRLFADFVSKYVGLSTDSLLSTPYERLLKQGRLSELIQCLAIGSVGWKSSPDINDLYSSNEGGVECKYLITDWSYYGLHSWPPTFSLSGGAGTLTEADLPNTLKLLFRLRANIIKNSRSILSMKSNYDFSGLTDGHIATQIVSWQSLLPISALKGECFGFHSNFDALISNDQLSWVKICKMFHENNTSMELSQSISSSLRYAALSLLQISSIKASDNVLESSDLFKRIYHTCIYWMEFLSRQEPSQSTLPFEDIFFHILRILLPSLSFIESSEVEIQLMQLCLFAIRKIVNRIHSGYIPSKELLELAKSNNFTLLRARAQEQLIKYKNHHLGDVSDQAYNLTQLVFGLEFIQRKSGSIIHSNTISNAIFLINNPVENTVPLTQNLARKSSKSSNNLWTVKVQSTVTSSPKIVGVRASSVDADLSQCASSGLNALNYVPTAGDIDHTISSNSHSLVGLENIMIEVAIGTSGAGQSNSSTANDVIFETVYCGTSLRFVQSGLVSDCVYFMKCRAYVASVPLSWSPPIEFLTEHGALFTFDSMKCGSDILLSDDSLTASYVGDDNWSTVLGTKSFSSGVTSWEIRINQSSTAYIFVGVAASAADLSTFLGGCSYGWGFIGEQALYHNREKVKIYGEMFGSGDVIGVTLDLNHGTLSFSRNRKSLGVAFDKIYGELYPAVAFYNASQELEILSSSFKSTCVQDPLPISPSRLNLDELSLLNELVICINNRQALSNRLLLLISEQCNQWCSPNQIRCRTVSGKEIFLCNDSPILKKFGFIVGERIRTTYGIAVVAGSAHNRIWFHMNKAGEVWYFSNQQITEGRSKKLFMRCTYETSDPIHSNANSPTGVGQAKSSDYSQSNLSYDLSSIQDLTDPMKWSAEMDNVLLKYLMQLTESLNLTSPWRITPDHIRDNFRNLQQQLSRLMLSRHDLAHRWGIAGPKRKAVLARMGMLRSLNQLLEIYFPFLISDVTKKPFSAIENSGAVGKVGEFNPTFYSLIGYNPTDEKKKQTSTLPPVSFRSSPSRKVNVFLNWLPAGSQQSSRDMHFGPLHAIRSRIFTNLKHIHFWEVIRKSATRPAKTEDDYDYPDDLPLVKINRLKSFRAKEASELLGIPGADLIMSSIFCQMWLELGKHSAEKLRIIYTHPMDDGQSRAFKIKFDGEGVDDYGGPYREIFQQMCDELQSPDPSVSGHNRARPSSWVQGEAVQNPINMVEKDGHPTAPAVFSSSLSSLQGQLEKPSSVGQPVESSTESSAPPRCFLPLLIPTMNWNAGECDERYRYTFNPASTSEFHLELFFFMGQMIGIAIRSKITLDLSFPSYIWKMLTTERLTDLDIASFDVTASDSIQRLANVYQRLFVHPDREDEFSKQVLEATAEDLVADLNWTVTRSDGVVMEMIENGAERVVKVEEIGRYLELYVEMRLSESIPAIEKFRDGLLSIIPQSSIALLTWDELQSLVCGTRSIDISRLRDNTEYDEDISVDDIHIQYFWTILHEDFSEEEKSAFLKFVWARPTLPPKGAEFTQKMRILNAVGEDSSMKPDQYLPKAHTCFFSINLPKYTSRKIMAEKLRYAIFNCTEMDADFRTTETDIVGWGGATANVSGNSATDWQF